MLGRELEAANRITCRLERALGALITREPNEVLLETLRLVALALIAISICETPLGVAAVLAPALLPGLLLFGYSTHLLSLKELWSES